MRKTISILMFVLAFLAANFAGKARIIEAVYEKTLDGLAFLQNKNSAIEVSRVSLYRQYAKDDPLNIYFMCRDSDMKKPFYSVFSQHPLSDIRLIQSDSSKETFIFWCDNSIICLCDLTQLVPYNGYGNSFSAGFPAHWQAQYFIDLSQYENSKQCFINASNECNFFVASVDRAVTGLTFTATNGTGGQFKFTKSVDGWRVFAGSNEVHQVKTNVLDMSKLSFYSAYSAFSTAITFKNSRGESRNVGASLLVHPCKLVSTGNNYCLYQLVEATNQEVALSRPIWSEMFGGGMRCYASVVKLDGGDVYYLCFTDFHSQLCVSAIPEVLPDGGYVADPTVGPLSQPKDDPFVRGGVDQIIDLRQFSDYKRFFKDGGGVASASEANKVLTLTVTNAAGSKFTFSNPDGQWHAYSFWGEISRTK